MFADQFTPTETGYLFRRRLKGPAIRVSSAEHQRFLADYDRALSWQFWGTVGGTLLYFLVMLPIVIRTSSGADSPLLYLPLLLVVALPLYGIFRAYAAPVRVLASRVPVAPALSEDEARKAGFARMTWGHLGSGVLLLTALAFQVAMKQDLRSGWNRLWILAFALGYLLIAVQAIRKWRIEREP